MNSELTKAAQRLPHDETHDWGDRIAKLQRPAAQTAKPDLSGHDAFDVLSGSDQSRASLAAPQQATPAQEPGVFREYFDAHCALIAAKNASEKASHAHIVGYRAPSHSTGSEPYETSVTRNDQLKRADDAARGVRKEAEARFNAALSAAQSAAQQATPEPLIVKGAMAGMVDAQVRDLWPTKGATLAPQQATPATPEDMNVYGGIAAGYFADTQQATPEPVTLGPLAKRNIYDAIRGAYDLGYNDARNARTVPGDSAPGYDGRSVEEDHGGALFNTLNRRLAATPEPVGEVVARVELMQTGGNAGLATRIVEIDDPLRERLRPGDVLYTRPAAAPAPEPTINWFGTHFTYKNQPCDNVTCWRLGEAARSAKPGGDLIDHGLSLLQELEKHGYGVFSLAAAQAKGGEHA